jgi:hypothetical protein
MSSVYAGFLGSCCIFRCSASPYWSSSTWWACLFRMSESVGLSIFVTFNLLCSYVVWAYCLHLLALLCYINSFCLVSAAASISISLRMTTTCNYQIFQKWEKTLEIEFTNQVVGRFSNFIMVLNVLATIPMLILMGNCIQYLNC